MNRIKSMLCSPLFWVMLIVITEFGINIGKWSMPFLDEHGADPDSYIKASYNVGSILNGDIDIARPPIYPVFIAMSRSIVGEHYALNLTIILQRVIGIVSLSVLYFTCRFFFKSKYLPAAVTIFYAVLMIFLRRFDTWIMSEPLSMSLTIFFFYLLVSYSCNAAYWKAIILGSSIFFFVMLRPAFMVFVPVVFVYWLGQLVFFQKTGGGNYRKDLAGLSATVFSVLLIISYSYLVYLKCGIFQVSAIASYNQFMCVIQSGISQNGSDRKINARIQECLEEFKKNYSEKLKDPNWMFDREVDAINSPLGYVQYVYPLVSPQNESVFLSQKTEYLKIKDYTTQTLRRNKLAYAEYIIKKMFWVSYSELRVGIVYAVLAVSASVLLFSLRKQDKIVNWLHFICWSLTFVMVFVSMAVSYSSYGRIILPVLSLALVQAFIPVDRLLTVITRRD